MSWFDKDSRMNKRGGTFIEDWGHPFFHRYRALPSVFQQIAGRVYRSLPANWRFGLEYGKTAAMLNHSETLSREQLQEMQLVRFQELIRHAYDNVPYYRRLFDQHALKPTEITSLTDLRKIPCLTKELVRQHSNELLATNIPPSRRLYMNTGGSTGVPLDVYFEKGVSRSREWAFMHTQWSRVGWREGDSSVVLRGWSVPKGIWQYEPIRRRLIMSAYHLTETNLPVYVQKLRDFAPKFIEAYPSNLTVLARYMQRNALPPVRSVKAILAGSENLFPVQRELLETVFDCRVYSWYGQGEIVALGGECEVSHDLHMFPEYGVFELLTETGDPVTTAGEIGEIIGTGFNNYAMPFIRYRTRDMGVLADGPCGCGRNYPRLTRVEGRKQELVVTNDGSVVTLTGLIFGQHFHAFSNIKRMQLVQVALGELILRIVPDTDYSQRNDETEIRAKIQAATGDRLKLRFDYVDDIPRTVSGKHLFLIQALPIDEYLGGKPF